MRFAALVRGDKRQSNRTLLNRRLPNSSGSVYTGYVNVWSGLDDTGTLLATLTLPPIGSGSGCPTYECIWAPVGVTFSGTAYSVDFGGSADQIAFDNITLGSATPGTPEPSTLVMFGSGLLGLAGIIRRKLNV